MIPIPKNIYGVTKFAAENLCELFHCLHGLSVIVLRTSSLFPEADDDTAIRENYELDNVYANEMLYRRVDVEDVVPRTPPGADKALKSASRTLSFRPRRRSPQAIDQHFAATRTASCAGYSHRTRLPTHPSNGKCFQPLTVSTSIIGPWPSCSGGRCLIFSTSSSVSRSGRTFGALSPVKLEVRAITRKFLSEGRSRSSRGIHRKLLAGLGPGQAEVRKWSSDGSRGLQTVLGDPFEQAFARH